MLWITSSSLLFHSSIQSKISTVAFFFLLTTSSRFFLYHYFSKLQTLNYGNLSNWIFSWRIRTCVPWDLRFLWYDILYVLSSLFHRPISCFSTTPLTTKSSILAGIFLSLLILPASVYRKGNSNLLVIGI